MAACELDDILVNFLRCDCSIVVIEKVSSTDRDVSIGKIIYYLGFSSKRSRKKRNR